jgi:hypothetical protein
VGKIINGNRVLIGKREGKGPLGRSGIEWLSLRNFILGCERDLSG